MIKKQVFIIEMYNMQDAWEGKLRWIQEDEEALFYSSLEMLQLISSVVDSADNGKYMIPVLPSQTEKSGDAAAGEARQRERRRFCKIKKPERRETRQSDGIINERG